MQITRVSSYSGIKRTKEINVTQEQLDSWKNGELIQKAMPDVLPEDREFIINGMTKDEWNELFPPEEE